MVVLAMMIQWCGGDAGADDDIADEGADALILLLMMINSQFTLFRPLNRVLRAFLDARLEFLLLQRDCHQSVVCALID